MDGTDLDDLKELEGLPNKPEHGLSHQEQEWLSTWFTEITSRQDKQNELLGKINGSLVFIVIVIIVGIIAIFLRGCAGL